MDTTAMMQKNNSLQLDYYHGNEEEKFPFLRIPKQLLQKEFAELSSDAKLLYGILLDRMQLSLKNHWVDAEDRVYVIYRIAEIMEVFGYSNKKAGEMLKELQNIGLIDKKRRGQGKPDFIYVKKIVQTTTEVSEKEENHTLPISETVLVKEPEAEVIELEKEEIVDEQAKKETLESEENSDYFQKCKKYTSESEYFSQAVVQEMLESLFLKCKNYIQESNTNINNNNNNTNINNLSIYPSNTRLIHTDEIGQTVSNFEQYRTIIRENIEYDTLKQSLQLSAYDKNLVDELYEIICDVVCIPRKELLHRPYEVVKAQFMKLNARHIKYVIHCMRNNTNTIKNIKNYLTTCLYNAVGTMHYYYQQQKNNYRVQMMM